VHRQYFAASREIPSLYGARLSFALAGWAELAGWHPPARQALVDARQEAADRLLPPPGAGGAGDRPDGAPSTSTPGDTFAEVCALSEVLGEPEFAVDLFAELDERAPATAADCAIAAHRLLMRTGRYDLARRYLLDPLAKVTRLAEVLQMRLNRNAGRAGEESREASRRDAVRDYTTGVRDVLILLTSSGEAELAEATRRRAVEKVSWGHIREEVAQVLQDS
jgi:hypothetical protein